MKKFNFKVLVLFAAVTLLMSSCASIKKMKKNADQIKWDVTPEVLEAHAGQVNVSVEGQIPEKYFVKKATLTVTPVVKYEGGETAYPEIKLQGESVTANNAVISFTDGGNFSVKGALPYEESMRMSELIVKIAAQKGAAALDFDPIKIADGVIATSELVDKSGAAIVGIQKEENTSGKYDPTIDKFQRVVPDEFIADLHYLINSSYIRGEEVKSDDINEFKNYTKSANDDERKDLKNVEVTAYASPDGELDWNEKLSKKRESTASDYLKNELKKLEVEKDVKTKYTAEDWEGFKELMEESSIQDKELILRVLNMYSDPEVREKEIRNLSEAFTAVAEEILPELRRAKFIASIDLIGKTDAELLAAAENNPASLNQAELLEAANLTDDIAKKKAFYKSFTKQFEDDWRGYNNLGMTQVMDGDFDAAAKNFEKADQLDNNNPIIKNNLGVIALKAGDINKAKELFSAASGIAPEVNYNMGIVSITRAEYDKAVQFFGECTQPNAALAKILAGDNNGALKVLESSEDDGAMVDYLKAVVGARTAKENLLTESLSAAVAKDASLKAAAKSDLEFAKYFENPKFKEIVE
ncbi:MAG: tetratricopeptide repeat protein [Prolixibacteraceae bacterium]|nr:tetratricopeptide repeat protein [Prolixibacteraceae bacterium]MBN2648497.1 tetratricopeptide repeat protein [Prolixibacteraceae bacterium]